MAEHHRSEFFDDGNAHRPLLHGSEICSTHSAARYHRCYDVFLTWYHEMLAQLNDLERWDQSFRKKLDLHRVQQAFQTQRRRQVQPLCTDAKLACFQE